MRFTASLPRFYFSLLSCYMLCLLISATNKKVVVCRAKYTGLMDRKISSYIFPICHFCVGLSNVEMEGRKKKSVIQNLYGGFFFLDSYLLSVVREEKLQSVNSPRVSETTNLRGGESPPKEISPLTTAGVKTRGVH